MEKFPENFHRKNYEIVTPRSQACSLRKSIYVIFKRNSSTLTSALTI